MSETKSQKGIGDYLLIGDLHTSALVKNGSIDWLCLPHFDSPSIFAKLLDNEGGNFSIENSGYNVKSEYEDLTAIVKTDFNGKNNSFSVKDFMVPQERPKCHNHLLVRKIIGKKGTSKVKISFNPKPNYAKTKPRIKEGQNELTLKHNKKEIKLVLPKGSKLRKTTKGYNIELELKENETKKLVLYEGNCELEESNHEKTTKDFWKKWVSKGKFVSFCKNRMARSAITLKLMQFYPTGAIIASPTTSLPETIGGIRNWDYRYTWIRDATFTLYGLYVLGYKEEAKKFFEFIEKIASKCKNGIADLDLIYTIDGKSIPKEKKLNHLGGYKNSKPVRVGNKASKQFQLDIYGSLLDSYYFMTKRNIKISKEGKKVVKGLVEAIKNNWKKKDNGIWEVRGKKQNFTYSKVMAWVGVDRATRMCEKLGISKKEKHEWINLKEKISEWIWKNCFDKKNKAFRQYPKTNEQDATNFLFVLLQFLDKHDPKTEEIIENTAKELLNKDVFVYRYKGKDNLPGKEGAFILCSFWYISALSILEKIKRSEKTFKKFEKYLTNLISEEIDPKTGKYLGNYPQAFSHLGYIMSAYYIDRYKKKLKRK